MQLHLNGQDLDGAAELILAEADVAAHLVDYIDQIPAAARPLGIRVSGGVPNAIDLDRAAREHLFIKVCGQEAAD